MFLLVNPWKNFGERVRSQVSRMSNGRTLVWEVVCLEPIRGTGQLELMIHLSELKIFVHFNLQ